MLLKNCTVEEEYEKNNDLKKEDVRLLKEWMNKQPHLPKISEHKLILFLNSCYFKIEATKTCIENFYTVRAHWPEFSQRRDVFSKNIQQTLHAILATLLPIPTKHNHLIMYSRLLNPSTDIFDPLDQIKVFDMIVTLYFKIVGTSEGQVYVMDTEGLSLGHILKVNLTMIKKHMFYIQEAYPMRLKAIHLINVSPMTEKLLSISKPFMNKGMIDLIHLHPKLDTLYEYIPKEALPNEYGGQAGTFKELQEKMIKLVEENADYFREEEKEIVDESKRQGKQKNLEDIFGIEGTFKKLDID